MDPLLDSIASKIRQHPKLVIADDFEIAIQRSATEETVFSNGVHRRQTHQDRFWVSLRILHRKRGGRAVVSDLSSASLSSLVEAAFDSANRAAVDPWFRFPLWKPATAKKPPVSRHGFHYTSLYDRVAADCRFFEESYSDHIIETVLRRKTERGELRHERQVHALAFSLLASTADQTLLLKEERSHAGELSERGQWLETLVQSAASRNKRAAKPAGRGKRKAVLSPQVAARLLKAIAPWFSAERVQLGRSPLREKLGEAIFSPVLTLVDEGGAEGAAPFDLEGVPTQRTVLVDKGNLKTWLYDVYSATRDNRLSTGNYLRGLAEDHPVVQASHLCFEAGTISQQTLLEQMGNGIFIDCLDVLEPLPSEGGKFFLRGSGWRIAFGQCSEPLSDVESIVDISELFRSAVSVAKDLSFFGDYGSPSIFFEEIPLGS